MKTDIDSMEQLAATTKRLSRLLLAIGGNRFELLMVAVQEERDFLLHAILLALAVAGFGLLAVMTLTAAIAVLGWPYSPPGVLATLAVLHGAVGFYLYRRLAHCLRDWHMLSTLLDQLRKDRAALEQTIS